jgi:crotonobetaine/carnitine-CoA ligase
MNYSLGLPVIHELQRAARDDGDLPFLTIDGDNFTYAEAWANTLAVAHGLRGHGVAPGDRVAILMANRAEAVWAWFGTLAAGGVDVPLNAESQGGQLAYLLSDSAPRVLISTTDLIERLINTEAQMSPMVIDVDGEVWAHLTRKGGSASQPATARLGDLASIVYTSGTTGASKGVMWSHGHYPSMVQLYAEWAGFTRDLSLYCAQPLYHLDARAAVLLALYLRGRTTLATRFSVSKFWSDIDHAQANAFVFIGTMLQLLAKQTGTERSSDTQPLIGFGTAIPSAQQRELEERFNVRLLEGYGTTEMPLILACRRDSTITGTVGTPADGVEVALLDEHDNPVPQGEHGVLCLRTQIPHSMTMGYWGKPEATVAACTNLWFHTGDLLRQLPNGGYEYVGRQKDSIRRRGENISAWEVEQAALDHSDVMECAAFGVPSDVGDEDVALLVVVRSDSSLDERSLATFMSNNVAKFAIPRYVEFVDSLPKTPSERVNKGAVRERGLTSAAVDVHTAP